MIFFSAAAAKDDDDDDGQSKDDDNQSDYFADVETSSCGSFELDIGWSAFEDGEADVKATPYLHTSPCGSFEVDIGLSDSEDGEGMFGYKLTLILFLLRWYKHVTHYNYPLCLD